MSMLTLSTIGCKKTVVGDSIKVDRLNLKFLPESGKSWNNNEEIGIFSYCMRGTEQSVKMSVNEVAKYISNINSDQTVSLNKASENDNVVATPADSDFRFYGYTPYSNANTDVTAIKAEVPVQQTYSGPSGNAILYAASKMEAVIVPTINLEFKPVFSVIDFFLPKNLVDDNGNSVVRSIALRPRTKNNFTGTLVDGGTYNLETGVFTSDEKTQADSVLMDFGATGITLTDDFTKVSVAVAPFTVPIDGMEVIVTDLSGNRSTIVALKTEEGNAIKAGEVWTQYLDKDNDGIMPVTFPVVFPLGKINGVNSVTATNQPNWVSQGIWICTPQPQAYAQWVKDAPDPLSSRNFTNSDPISSPGINGIWTGDYLEFVLPVRQFAAGTKVKMKFPLYTRQGPIYWVIEYLDGTEWKSNVQSIASYASGYTRDATFAMNYGGNVIEDSMTFANAIESGLLRIRLRCVDGSLQASAATTVTQRTTPNLVSGAYSTVFYFYMAGSDVTSVSFSVE